MSHFPLFARRCMAAPVRSPSDESVRPHERCVFPRGREVESRHLRIQCGSINNVSARSVNPDSAGKPARINCEIGIGRDVGFSATFANDQSIRLVFIREGSPLAGADGKRVEWEVFGPLFQKVRIDRGNDVSKNEVKMRIPRPFRGMSRRRASDVPVLSRPEKTIRFVSHGAQSGTISCSKLFPAYSG